MRTARPAVVARHTTAATVPYVNPLYLIGLYREGKVWRGYVSYLTCSECGKKVHTDRELSLHKMRAHPTTDVRYQGVRDAVGKHTNRSTQVRDEPYIVAPVSLLSDTSHKMRVQSREATS